MAKAQRTPLIGNYREHKPVRQAFRLPSRTRREFREDCNVNIIMERFTKHAIPPKQNTVAPRFINAAAIPNLQTAMQIMIEADKAFGSLPALVRKHFDNSPIAFVEYAQNAENLEQLREWGIAPPAKVDKPLKVEVTNPPEPPAKT